MLNLLLRLNFLVLLNQALPLLAQSGYYQCGHKEITIGPSGKSNLIYAFRGSTTPIQVTFFANAYSVQDSIRFSIDGKTKGMIWFGEACASTTASGQDPIDCIHGPVEAIVNNDGMVIHHAADLFANNQLETQFGQFKSFTDLIPSDNPGGLLRAEITIPAHSCLLEIEMATPRKISSVIHGVLECPGHRPCNKELVVNKYDTFSVCNGQRVSAECAQNVQWISEGNHSYYGENTTLHEPGHYNVIASYADGCKAYGDVEIDCPQGSLPIIQNDPSDLVCGKTSLSVCTKRAELEWVTKSDTFSGPSIAVDEPQRVYVKATYPNGCVIEGSAEVDETDQYKENAFYIPNAFSPNDDGINDAIGLMSLPSCQLLIEEFGIYARWGEQVFYKDHYLLSEQSHSWDGKFRGKDMPGDVYAYMVRYRLPYCDQVKTKRGEFLLIR